jgi:hypothetical protein
VCHNAAIHADLRVSVQVRGARDRVRGHHAVGILADSPVVLVPNPPVRLLPPEPELEVLVIPVPLRTEALIERFTPRKIEVYTLRESAHRLELAVLYLQSSSRYTAQMDECDPDDLGAALDANGGDWWAALTALRIIPPGIDQVSDELLHEAGEMEREQYQPRYHTSEADAFHEIAGHVCHVTCRCTPPRRRGSPPIGGVDT